MHVRSKYVALALTILLVGLATPVGADGDTLPSCSDRPREEEFSQEIGYGAAAGTYYLNTQDENESKLGVWKETNTWTGLQTEDFTCDYFGEERFIPADTQLTPPI